MKPITDDTLDILIVLDRSGSMQQGRSDHEGGLKSFVRDQRTVDGDVRLTFIQFDGANPCDIIYDRTPLEDVDDGKLVLIPRGSTPLFSAVGRAFAHLRDAQVKAPSGQTVAMVITDGENTDYPDEWDKDKVQALTKSMEKDGTSVLYLGANVDAFSEGAKLGVAAAYAANYSATVPGSTSAVYTTLSNKVAGGRRARQLFKQAGMTGGGGGGATTASGTAFSFNAQDLSAFAAGGDVQFDGGQATFTSTVTAAQPSLANVVLPVPVNNDDEDDGA